MMVFGGSNQFKFPNRFVVVSILLIWANHIGSDFWNSDITTALFNYILVVNLLIQ